jgi:RNA-directed DNA polymerase
VKFGRSAYYQAKRMKTKPVTFDFLGFTHRMGTSRAGKFAMQVSTMKKRLRRALGAIAAWCREHLHTPLESQQQMLNAKLRGHYQYYGRPTNYRSLEKFVHTVGRIWRRWLARRTRGRRLPWPRFNRILARYPLLRPRITQAWPAS